MMLLIVLAALLLTLPHNVGHKSIVVMVTTAWLTSSEPRYARKCRPPPLIWVKRFLKSSLSCAATHNSITAERCAAQLLGGDPAGSAEEVAGRLLAIQAQDPRGARLPATRRLLLQARGEWPSRL